VLAGCGVLVFALGIITTTTWARGTVTRTAALFEAPASARTVARAEP
jgi:hypothetical protein